MKRRESAAETCVSSIDPYRRTADASSKMPSAPSYTLLCTIGSIAVRRVRQSLGDPTLGVDASLAAYAERHDDHQDSDDLSPGPERLMKFLQWTITAADAAAERSEEWLASHTTNLLLGMIAAADAAADWLVLAADWLVLRMKASEDWISPHVKELLPDVDPFTLRMLVFAICALGALLIWQFARAICSLTRLNGQYEVLRLEPLDTSPGLIRLLMQPKPRAPPCAGADGSTALCVIATCLPSRSFHGASEVAKKLLRHDVYTASLLVVRHAATKAS